MQAKHAVVLTIDEMGEGEGKQDIFVTSPQSIYTRAHGCVKSTVIERRQHQLGRMVDFPPPLTFSVFDL